jgi:hypothetical protein
MLKKKTGLLLTTVILTSVFFISVTPGHADGPDGGDGGSDPIIDVINGTLQKMAEFFTVIVRVIIVIFGALVIVGIKKGLLTGLMAKLTGNQMMFSSSLMEAAGIVGTAVFGGFLFILTPDLVRWLANDVGTHYSSAEMVAQFSTTPGVYTGSPGNLSISDAFRVDLLEEMVAQFLDYFSVAYIGIASVVAVPIVALGTLDAMTGKILGNVMHASRGWMKVVQAAGLLTVIFLSDQIIHSFLKVMATTFFVDIDIPLITAL